MDETRHGDYEVGYGRPPTAYRFPKGKSGNYNGRRGNKRAADKIDAIAILDAPVTAVVRGRRRKMSMFEADTRRLIKEGLGGNFRSLKAVIKRLEKYDLIITHPNPEGGVVWLTDAAHRAWLAGVEAEELGHDA